MPPLNTDDEAGRLAALRRYEVLDTAPEAPFDKITLLVKTIFSVPIALVSLVDADRQWFKSKQGLDVCETARDVSFCTHTIRQDEPLIIEDALADPRFADNPLVRGPLNIRFYGGVPLRTPDGYNVGSLCIIDTVPRAFDLAKLEILKSFAAVIVDELELRRIAQKDDLTGALSRRAFIAEAERALSEYGRHATSSALLLLDIDRFKLINDTHGHPAGDSVLRSLAATCMETLRRDDCFGRLGGEEFGILLRKALPADASRCAERFREVIAGMRVRHDPPLSVTASFGVAPCNASYAGTDSWLAAADSALYAAKARGRNRCCLTGDQPPPPTQARPIFETALPDLMTRTGNFVRAYPLK